MSDTNKLKIIVVGLGHQSLDDHIPAILESEHFELVGVVDIDEARARGVGAARSVPFAADIDTLLGNLKYQSAARASYASDSFAGTGIGTGRICLQTLTRVRDSNLPLY